jgi:hypothetical protein
MLAACGAFALALAARIARLVPVPALLVAALAAVALVLVAAVLVATVRAIARGPGRPPDDWSGAIRCEGEDAARVRGAALRTSPHDGAGYAHRWRLVLRAAACVAAAGVLSSGLLNVTLRTEGTWIQYAGSGRDLDVRETYDTLDLGVLADPAGLKYGLVLGEIRPRDPERLADVRVLAPDGTAVREEVLGVGRALDVAGIHVWPWGVGPAVHLTVLQKEAGRLLDAPIALWPSQAPGRYAQQLETGDLALSVAIDGWPAADDAERRPHVTLRKGDAILIDGAVMPRKVAEGYDGYAVIAWEIRPYVAFALAHRTFRSMTIGSMAALAVLLLATALLRPRPFWYREEGEGAVSIVPSGAWARLVRRRPR